METFYLWQQDLAHALFADIAALEVAMRSAMARELSKAHGASWYKRADLFDDDTIKMIVSAWSQNGLTTLEASSTTSLGTVEAKLGLAVGKLSVR